MIYCHNSAARLEAIGAGVVPAVDLSYQDHRQRASRVHLRPNEPHPQHGELLGTRADVRGRLTAIPAQLTVPPTVAWSARE